MILITCGCGKSIAAKPEWAGISLRCAGCGRSHSVNADAPAVGAPVVETAPAVGKDCPYCAGRIQAAAIKCRHCGRFLEEGPAVEAPAPSGTRPVDAGGVGTLVVALLAWVAFCFVPSPIAWLMGSMYESDCRARGVEPSGAGRVGRILGMIGTLFLLLGAGLFFLAALGGSDV